MIKPVEYSADHNESGKLSGTNTLNNLTTSRQLKGKATASNSEVVKHKGGKNFTSDDQKTKTSQSYKTISKTLLFKHYLEIQIKK